MLPVQPKAVAGGHGPTHAAARSGNNVLDSRVGSELRVSSMDYQPGISENMRYRAGG